MVDAEEGAVDTEFLGREGEVDGLKQDVGGRARLRLR
jgi:hypothetical protein